MFVVEYLVDMNATAAAKRAGYKERTANEQAVRLMKDERIQRAIQEEINARRERLRLSADDVLIMIMEAVQIKMSDFATWTEEGTVTFRPSDEVDSRFITKIKSTKKVIGHGDHAITEYETTLDIISKEKMLDMLFKHHGLAAPLKIDETIPFAQLVVGALEAIKSVKTDD